MQVSEEILNKMTKADLMAIGATGGLALTEDQTKADMVAAILATQEEAPAPEPAATAPQMPDFGDIEEPNTGIEPKVDEKPTTVNQGKFITPNRIPRGLGDRVAIILFQPPETTAKKQPFNLNGLRVSIPYDTPQFVPKCILEGPLKDARQVGYETIEGDRTGNPLGAQMMKAKPSASRFAYQQLHPGMEDYDTAVKNWQISKEQQSAVAA